MNWFKKKKEEPVQQPQQQQKTSEVQWEKQMNDINVHISKLDQLVENSEKKMEKLDAQIKELMKEKKKTQAMTKLKELNLVKEGMVDLDKKKTVFIQMKMKLELAKTDQDSVSVMSGVNQIIKEQEKVNDQLFDQIQDWQDYQQNQEQTKDLWNQLADQGTDQNELDNQLAEYEAELNKQEAVKVFDQFQGVQNANIPAYNVQQQPVQQQQQQPQQNKLEQQLLDGWGNI